MKILSMDIETSPHLSWHWRRWKENIPKSFTVQESRVLCWAAKWYGQKTIKFQSEWNVGSDEMLAQIWDLLDDADVVMGFNSKKFDVKRLNAEFVKRGWDAPSPYQQIDLYLQCKKNFAFSSNRLDDVLEELGLLQKLPNEGMKLWMRVMEGERIAQQQMKKYNIQDVEVTEQLYDHIRQWITPHPNMGLYVDDEGDENPACRTCGEKEMIRHKKRPTSVGLYQQWHCQNCGAYHRGRKNLKPGGVKNGVLA